MSEITRAVTNCDLTLLPALRQKLVFCTQMDTRTNRHANGWTDSLIPVYP